MSDFELILNALFVYPNLNTMLPDHKEHQTKLREELLNPKVDPFLHHSEFHTTTVPTNDIIVEDEDDSEVE